MVTGHISNTEASSSWWPLVNQKLLSRKCHQGKKSFFRFKLHDQQYIDSTNELNANLGGTSSYNLISGHFVFSLTGPLHICYGPLVFCLLFISVRDWGDTWICERVSLCLYMFYVSFPLAPFLVVYCYWLVCSILVCCYSISFYYFIIPILFFF